MSGSAAPTAATPVSASKLGVFTLAMMNFTAVVSLRGLRAEEQGRYALLSVMHYCISPRGTFSQSAEFPKLSPSVSGYPAKYMGIFWVNWPRLTAKLLSRQDIRKFPCSRLSARRCSGSTEHPADPFRRGRLGPHLIVRLLCHPDGFSNYCRGPTDLDTDFLD
jgi:hypothetical protein